MSKQKRPLKKWEELYVRFIFGILIGVLFYRMTSEWIVPNLIDTSMYQIEIIWGMTITLTIIVSETFRRILVK